MAWSQGKLPASVTEDKTADLRVTLSSPVSRRLVTRPLPPLPLEPPTPPPRKGRPRTLDLLRSLQSSCSQGWPIPTAVSRHGQMNRQSHSNYYQINTKPNQLNTKPNQLNARPNQLSARPNQLNARPNQLNISPKQLNASPKQLNASPKQLNIRPNQPTVRPNNLNIRPNQLNVVARETQKSRDEREQEDLQEYHEWHRSRPSRDYEEPPRVGQPRRGHTESHQEHVPLMTVTADKWLCEDGVHRNEPKLSCAYSCCKIS